MAKVVAEVNVKKTLKQSNQSMQKLPIAVVVIPTYNEAGTIGEMVDVLCGKIFPKIKDWQCKLLVVDDTSPDGTYKIVQKKQKKYNNLELYLNPTKAGIGGAYVKGFRHAMSVLKADVVIEFDGDFQHPPKDIPILLKEINAGYDYVLGSRKIKGGSNPKGWGFKRVFFSEVGGLAARFILFFPGKMFFKITDPTGGLKASRVKGFVDSMDMDHLYSKGFGYKMEFLYQMVQLGARVKEIPLQFGLRTKGESKIESKTAKDIFRSVFLLRWSDPTTQKFIKFGVVGGIGFVINTLGAKIIKSLFMVNPTNVSFVNGLSNALAAEVSIISNFTLNNLWTFKNERLVWGRKLIEKFVTFNLSSVISGIVIPTAVVVLLTSLFGDHLFLYQVIGIFLFTIPLNWFIYNLVIWKKKKN